MRQRFVSPGAYVQGAAALAAADEEFARLDAERAYLLGGETALSTVEDDVVAGLVDAGTTVTAVAAGVDQ